MLASGIRAIPRAGLPRAAPQLRKLRTLQTLNLPKQQLSYLNGPVLRPNFLRPAIARPAILIPFSTTAFRRSEIKPDTKREAELRKEKLERKPEGEVTTSSSVRNIIEPRAESADLPPMGKELKEEILVVKDTFAMKEVPRDLSMMGLLGLTPYVFTSASTLFLAWDVNYGKIHGAPYLFTQETAQYLSDVLQPIQVGYGAVILSFLGAIHWGLEFAKYGGQHGYKRYAIGVLAPLLAWPTVMLPLDYALLVQFVGFTAMYYADVLATSWGWSPSWYTNYRFLLTFVVGGCIVLTLIGHSRLGDTTTPSVLYVRDLERRQGDLLSEEEKLIEENIRKREEEERRKKEEAESKKRREKVSGALEQADKSRSRQSGGTESTEMRRQRDSEETFEEKEESRGAKRTGKPVDPRREHGTADEVPHEKASASQKPNEETLPNEEKKRSKK